MSVQRRVTRRDDGSKRTSYRVRWKQGRYTDADGRERERWHSRTFDRKRDADDFDAELRRRRRLGTLASIDLGTETSTSTSGMCGLRRTARSSRPRREPSTALSTTAM
jgi:hypothetical protein